jgi:hypothetical protein
MNPEPGTSLRALLAAVRGRWRRLIALKAIVRAALAVAGVIAVALALSRWTTLSGTPAMLAALGAAVLVATVALLAWALWPVRETPSDARVARFIEEAVPSLDDRLVSAVDVMVAAPDVSPLAGPMLADASRRASAVDPAAVVPPQRLRRAGFQAAASLLLVGAVGFGGRGVARQSFDALSLSLFPARVRLDVTPGNARIQAGTALTIEARLVGNSAPAVAQLLRGDGTPIEMSTDRSGAFRTSFNAVGASFKYRVRVGGVTSPEYDVVVARAPRVTRIDLDYTFPKELGLAPRTEEDGGDIYAPSGTDVRVRVHTDREAATAQLTLGNGRAIPLTPDGSGLLTASLTVLEDNSYRVALADHGGLKNPGDTEYFIRTLEDRPPDVRVIRPARDREVTRLEEVDVEARADDDFGIASMELVYAVRGGDPKVVPFDVPGHAASVSGKRTLYLEDLNVQPGDFISYYVRARDLTRGKQSSETRSDVFFLEVRPFDQEFTLAQNPGGGGSSNGHQIDELIQSQKDVIVSTWKLDRRAQAASAQSGDDVRAVGRAESDLKTRVEETSSAFRESTMRDPRARGPQRGRGAAPDGLRAGQTMPEEDDMTAAATAMGKAAATLEALKTSDAVPPEMTALDHLLKAQADVKKREVSQQQAGSGSAANRSNVDVSNLFDKELQRQDRTNYETKASAEQARDEASSALDKIRDLAKRQDELNRQQQDLTRNRAQMTVEEIQRELEKLTREQSDLRQRAEEIAQQMQQQGQQAGQPGQQNQQGSQSSQGSQGSQGSQSSQGSQGLQQSGQAMRAVSEAMQSAANGLRQQNPGQASQQGAQAADRLRQLERQLQPQGPDERRRALGDAQLEARQVADAQRQIASELNKLPGDPSSAGTPGTPGTPGTRGNPGDNDTLRRLAGEEERLADRAARVQDNLKQQGAGDVSREFEQQRLPDRMKQSAGETRAGTGLKGTAASDADMARTLDQLADKIANAAGPQDAEAEKLADQRAQAAQLRSQLEKSSADIQKAGAGTGGGSAADLARMRQAYSRQLQQTQQLLDQLKRDDPSLAQGGVGFTFQGQGMTLSAPGTEAFKQDFAKWEKLREQATTALGQAETFISKRLQAKQAGDRLAAGVDDQPPAAYETEVNSYFKALADRKKPH